MAMCRRIIASSGPNSPGTMADDATVGTLTWSTPDNAKVEDGTGTDVNGATNAITHYLKATNFSFSIPTNAVIDGIALEVKKTAIFAGVDSSVRIVKSGSITGSDYASGTAWPVFSVSGYQYSTYGGSTDLWGTTWFPSDINDSTFGAVFSGQITSSGPGNDLSVDHMRITVYYHTSNFFPLL